MNVSIPLSLANVTISNINFTGDCGNVALGYNVWYNDFFLQQPTEGNWTTTSNSLNDGPGAYANIWLNGTSPEFIRFWRATLSPSHPEMNYSDTEIVRWTNSSPFYDFFGDDLGNAWPRPDKKDQIANSLASSGGCKNNNSQDAGDIKQYSQFQQGKRPRTYRC